MVAQATELCAKPHVVVATPGRSVHLMLMINLEKSFHLFFTGIHHHF